MIAIKGLRCSGHPSPLLDAVTWSISGRKTIADRPDVGAEVFFRVFNALKGPLRQFLNLHSQVKKITTAMATVI